MSTRGSSGLRKSRASPTNRLMAHSIVTLAEVAAALGDAAAARALRPELARWSGRIAYDGVNGPLEPVDDFVSRLDGLLTPAAR